MNKSNFLLCLVVVVCAQELEAEGFLTDIYSTKDPPIFSVLQSKNSSYLPCKINDNTAGFCVPYYICSNNIINQDGSGNIDQRINVCPGLQDMCCKVAEIIEEKPDPPKVPPIRKEGCGWRNPDGVGLKPTRDINGESKFGEFPWMVAIFNTVYVGGGSLIHPAVVLTVAHKVAKDTKLKVRAGEWDTQTVEEAYPYQERDVLSKIIHKDFNDQNLFNSIALLFLSARMDTSVPNVGLACLPPPRQRVPAGVQCTTGGWGKDMFGKAGMYQDILKKVTVPVVERKQCQTQLRKTRLGYFFMLHSSFMCAGGEAGIDTCKGDGGSPLVCPIENEQDRYIQWGMVAWGIGCGDGGIPGVYVDVSQFRDWIDEGLGRVLI